MTPDQVAAVVIEPELGEGGFVPAPAAFMQRLRALTERFGIVFIADEVQSGFGRTGKMFGYQHAGITPDLIAIAKSLAAGLPLSAVVGKAAIMDAPLAGGLGGTYAGNPLACAAALAVLDVFETEGLVERAAQLGAQIREALLRLQARVPQIGDVRGLGCMLAIELVTDRATKEPDADLAQRVIDRARDRGCCCSSAVRTRTSCGCCRRSPPRSRIAARVARPMPSLTRSAFPDPRAGSEILVAPRAERVRQHAADFDDDAGGQREQRRPRRVGRRRDQNRAALHRRELARVAHDDDVRFD